MIGACRIAIFVRIVWYLGINMKGIGRWIILYFVPREDDKSILNGELFGSFRGVCNLMEVKQLYYMVRFYHY